MSTNIKKALSLLGMIVGVMAVMGIAIYFLYSQIRPVDLIGKDIVITEDDDALEVVDEDGNVVFDYSMSDWRTYTENRWEYLFDGTIEINETELGPRSFQRFVAASPLVDPTKMIFAVSTYGAPTDVSLFFVLDIRTEELELVGRENKGIIGNILWSPTGTHFAYFLNTERAPGDYLTVDNVETLEKEFVLEDRDILLALGVGEEEIGEGVIEFTPEFRNLAWEEEGERLMFVTDVLEEDEEASWSINADGTDILLKEEEDNEE